MFFATLLLIGAIAGAVWIFNKSVLPIFRGDDLLMWEKWGPAVLLAPLMLGALWLKGLVVTLRPRDPDNPSFHLRPAFKYDQYIIVSIGLLAIIAPFIAQPIVDFIVMPSLGYEYCEPLTTRQSTFGFPAYAYVSDPALCVG